MKIICQIQPSTMPPMRLGMNSTVRNRLVPRMPRVSSEAMAKPITLMEITLTTANFTVNHSALTNSLLAVKAVM